MSIGPEDFITPATKEERAANIARELIYRFGLSEEEAADFIEDFNRPAQAAAPEPGSAEDEAQTPIRL